MTKAIQFNSEFLDAYYNRAVIYYEKEKFHSAIADYTKTIQLKPDHVLAYNNRGITYFVIGKTHLAIADFTKVIQLQPDNSMAYYTRAKLWLYEKAWEKAKSDLMFARARGMDVTTLFNEEYGSVLEFKRRIGIQLPADIVAMLTPQA